MADLANRVTLISAEETVGIRVAAVLLLLVFAIKAALVPLHFWLPSSYAEAPAPVAALFAIMTKVGAYAIIRVYTLIFPPDLEVTAGLHDTWLLPAALGLAGDRHGRCAWRPNAGPVGGLFDHRVDGYGDGVDCAFHARQASRPRSTTSSTRHWQGPRCS